MKSFKNIWLVVWRFFRRFCPCSPGVTIAGSPDRVLSGGSETSQQALLKFSEVRPCYGLHEPGTTSGEHSAGFSSYNAQSSSSLPDMSSENVGDDGSYTAIEIILPPDESRAESDGHFQGFNTSRESEYGGVWDKSSLLGVGSNRYSISGDSLSSRSSVSSNMTTSSRRNIASQAFWTPNNSVYVLPSVKSEEEFGMERLLSSSTEISKVIYPLHPTKLQDERYKRKRYIDKLDELPEVEIRPNDRVFSFDAPPEGWVQYIHPEGRPMFYNEEQRIATESWIFDVEIYQYLTSFISQIGDFIRANNFDMPSDYHLVLDVENKLKDGGYLCGYYFVCHSTRTVFWLERCDLSELFSNVKTEAPPPRIKIQMERQYWTHWDLFPNINKLNRQILNDMANIVMDVRTDKITSAEDTTLNYTMEQLKDWAVLLNDAREYMKFGPESPSSWFVGRFMSYICFNRFYNFYGQRGARLSRTQTVHDLPKPSRSYLVKILSPMLFSAPNIHLAKMDELWVDKLTILGHWTKFYDQLRGEWGDHTFYSSLLLNANVAFLAIPSNDNGDTKGSAVQIASYLSIITVSASIMTALLLARQYKTGKHFEEVSKLNAFLNKSKHPIRGFEALAILYSLPYALLIWGMVTFFAAFFSMCFGRSTLSTVIIVAIACLLAGVLLLWCIWMGWEEVQDHWWKRIYSSMRDEWRGESQTNDSGVATKMFGKIPWPSNFLRRFGHKARQSTSNA